MRNTARLVARTGALAASLEGVGGGWQRLAACPSAASCLASDARAASSVVGRPSDVPGGLRDVPGSPKRSTATWVVREATPARRAACEALVPKTPPAGWRSAHAAVDAADPAAKNGVEPEEEPKVIFEASWRKIEAELGPENMIPPREIVWLNGAPGAGKGANTPFLMKTRGLSRAAAVSSLLDNDTEVKRLKDEGALIPDSRVMDVLLQWIFDPDFSDGTGILIDGFPRTGLQADMLKLLYDSMTDQHHRYRGTPLASKFPRPSFKIVVLYVDEDTSIKRQQQRAQKAGIKNKRTLDAGLGELSEVRATDLDEQRCRKRYTTFKEHYGAMLRLMQFFPFALIDAMGTVQDCEAQIARELRYQSDLDLCEETYLAIQHLPLAKEVVTRSRQQLVARLDTYATCERETFSRVISHLDGHVIPGVVKSSLSGFYEHRTSDPLFLEHPQAIDMLIDILSDRGFQCSHTTDMRLVPTRFDMRTGEVHSVEHATHRFRIQFPTENVRELAQARNADQRKSRASAAQKLHINKVLESNKAGVIPPRLSSELEHMMDVIRHPSHDQEEEDKRKKEAEDRLWEEQLGYGD
ncbi:unnamed protein product [Pedinophyceae sp. YPF-701]|nr:unnamed protein product [Pedinophyceae sp. YPF-701]